MIGDLAHQLSVEHFPYFSEDQLKDKDFPWTAFFKKPGFGPYLRNPLRTLLTLPHMRWKELTAHQSEVAALFSLSADKVTGTKNLLNSLTVIQFKLFAGQLTTEHLPLLDKSTLNDPQFPWDHFCALDNIGETVRKLATKDNPKLLLKYLSWNILLRKPEELKKLFVIEQYANADLELLLGQLEIPVIQELAPLLGVDYFPFFSDDHLKHPDFPWSFFFKEPGIGRYLRPRLSDEILKCTHIDWAELAIQEKEVQSLFTLSSFGGRADYLLKRLSAAQIKLFAPHLTVDHLPCFYNHQLTSQFPWNHFCKLEGFGEKVRHMATKQNPKLPLTSLPWQILNTEKKEINALFRLDPMGGSDMTTLLHGLADDALVYLFREKVLTEKHKYFLKLEQKKFLIDNATLISK